MTSLLLIISFLLHLISLFAIYQLFKQIQSQKSENNASEQVMAVLESYLQEIKAENNRLQQIVKQEEIRQGERMKRSEPNQEKMQQTKEKIKNSSEEDNSSLDHLLNELPGDDLETSLQSRILQLHAQGLNVEEIAKKLNCGKTEVELIIKFHQRN